MITNQSKLKKNLLTAAIVLTAVLLFLYLLGGTVQAATGLVDDTVNTEHEYSKYALDNYQLDYRMGDTNFWEIGEKIKNQIMYGLHCMANFIWQISMLLSNATGYLVKEAFSLDFIGQTADKIGANIQTIAGVTPQGFSSSGFYPQMLLILIFIVGIYVAYVGLIKHETAKAVKAVTNFVVVFLISASFIAYAPDYIKKVNDFSADMSTTALETGTKIVLPDSETKGKDSVDLIRDSLHGIQIKTPWMLLQFGNSDIEKIGADRVEALLSAEPGSDLREGIVKAEIDGGNNNLTIDKAVSRLGTVVFLFLFNLLISVFVFLLTAIMLFSQVLFIIFAMFLPVALLLSTIPTFEGVGKRAILKVFNTIMTRAGITLVISAAFSISAMLYSLAGSSPFFLIAFLQIVTFAGIYFKLGDILRMFSLEGSESQSGLRRFMHYPRMMMHRQSRRISRAFRRHGKSDKAHSGRKRPPKQDKQDERPNNGNTEQSKREPNQSGDKTGNKTGRGPAVTERLGRTVGNLLDTKDKVTGKLGDLKQGVKNIPTNAKYSLYQKKQQAKEAGNRFTSSMRDTREGNRKQREKRRFRQKQTAAGKRREMEMQYRPDLQGGFHTNNRGDDSAAKNVQSTAQRRKSS